MIVLCCRSAGGSAGTVCGRGARIAGEGDQHDRMAPETYPQTGQLDELEQTMVHPHTRSVPTL